MQFLNDRFLILVVIITAAVILGMFIFQRQINREIQSNPAFKSIPSTSVPQPLPSEGPFRIIRVLDGDTIILDNGETVRLIGVDAPEIHHSEIPVQRFGEEAAKMADKTDWNIAGHKYASIFLEEGLAEMEALLEKVLERLTR